MITNASRPKEKTPWNQSTQLNFSQGPEWNSGEGKKKKKKGQAW
jgi:hypothetical protein